MERGLADAAGEEEALPPPPRLGVAPEEAEAETEGLREGEVERTGDADALGECVEDTESLGLAEGEGAAEAVPPPPPPSPPPLPAPFPAPPALAVAQPEAGAEGVPQALAVAGEVRV